MLQELLARKIEIEQSRDSQAFEAVSVAPWSVASHSIMDISKEDQKESLQTNRVECARQSNRRPERSPAERARSRLHSAYSLDDQLYYHRGSNGSWEVL